MLKQESIFSPEINSIEQLQGALLQLKKKDELIEKKDKLINQYKQNIEWLTEQLATLKRAQFGKKSEKWESKEQIVFNEIEAEAKSADSAEEDETDKTTTDITVAGHTKKRGHRRPLPQNLPREEVEIELPPDEQVSEDGTKLKIIGWETSEKLKYVPSALTVVVTKRAKYGVDSGDYVKTAPQEPAIIPKGIATPELLAAIIVSKYCDGLPLYRLEDIFTRHGVDLSRGTMARWMVQVAEALMPIRNVLSDRLLASFYVACDETAVQVLKENGRKAEDKSWMWVRSVPFGEKKIVLFDYSPSRSGVIASELFADYRGFIQCDGLNVYNVLEKEHVTRLGCGMHARRRFEQAAIDGAKTGKSLGEKGLLLFKKLYDLEEEIKDKPSDERYRIRYETALPIWQEIKKWSDENHSKVPKKSKIGNAFLYLINEYEYLIGYLKDGRLNIDNGFTERAIRKFAIGRNNWMFSDTVDGANASSLLYSLIVTAKVNGVDPYRAMVKLCTEIPKAKTLEDYERLAEIILVPEIKSDKTGS